MTLILDPDDPTGWREAPVAATDERAGEPRGAGHAASDRLTAGRG